MAEHWGALRSFEQVRDPGERRLFLTRLLESLDDAEKRYLVMLMAEILNAKELTMLMQLAKARLSLQPDPDLEDEFNAVMARFEARVDREEAEVEREAEHIRTYVERISRRLGFRNDD